MSAVVLAGVVSLSGCTAAQSPASPPTPTPTVVPSFQAPVHILIVPTPGLRGRPRTVRLGQLVELRIHPGGAPSNWSIPAWTPVSSLSMLRVATTNQGGLDVVFATLRTGRVLITTSACIPDPCSDAQATLIVR
jgi:hypothetical protein